MIEDAREFLTGVMQGRIEPTAGQLDAAKALVRDAGASKKVQKQEAAEKAAEQGRFAPASAPLRRVA
jgi:hypothetical protein